jgi:hypothetical protein
MAMRRSWARPCWTVALACALTWISSTLVDAHHAVLRFNLEEMVMSADRAFIGQCLDIQEGRESIGGGMLPVTRYTFDVQQVIKGDLPTTFTFTQLGYRLRKAAKSGTVSMNGQAVRPGIFIHGMSDYEVGDRLLLLLIPNYQNGRLTYPVGLDQGAFRISRLETGEEVAENGLNNLGLFSAPYTGTALRPSEARVVTPDVPDALASATTTMSASARSLSTRRGALPLGGLVELIDQIRVAHGGAKGVLRVTPKGGRP